MQYPAPGDPALAERIAGDLAKAGFVSRAIDGRGFDHGTWVPLTLLYPRADIPVVQVSVDPTQGPEHHLRLGRALAHLREEEILVIGSGSFTHNLREAFAALRAGRRQVEMPDWVSSFVRWMDSRIEAGDEAVADRLQKLPHPMPRAIIRRKNTSCLSTWPSAPRARAGAPRRSTKAMNSVCFRWTPSRLTGVRQPDQSLPASFCDYACDAEYDSGDDMRRLINAFWNSKAGIGYLVRNEAAFRTEVVASRRCRSGRLVACSLAFGLHLAGRFDRR